ncbi:hypothetical protein HYY74_02655 [Candidatus Woesearchaeota archaeon]|nr:hypothetical protein [Candidatus Woesearchaeota archaeon]
MNPVSRRHFSGVLAYVVGSAAKGRVPGMVLPERTLETAVLEQSGNVGRAARTTRFHYTFGWFRQGDPAWETPDRSGNIRYDVYTPDFQLSEYLSEKKPQLMADAWQALLGNYELRHTADAERMWQALDRRYGQLVEDCQAVWRESGKDCDVDGQVYNDGLTGFWLVIRNPLQRQMSVTAYHPRAPGTGHTAYSFPLTTAGYNGIVRELFTGPNSPGTRLI